MKKIYAMLLTAGLSMSAFAQDLQFEESTTETAALRAPHKSDIIDGTFLWGYWTDEEIDDTNVIKALGLQESSFNFDVCIKVPAGGMLKGAKIQAINFPVNMRAELSNYKVYVMAADMKTKLATQTIDVKNLEEWALNTAVLDTPVEITEDVYVGMSFKGTSVDGGATVQSLLLHKGANQPGSFYWKQGENWLDLSAGYGALPIQIQVTDAKVGTYNCWLESITDITDPSIQYLYKMNLHADGQVDVKNVEYTVTVGEQVDTYTADVKLKPGLNQFQQIDVTFKSPVAAGDYDVNFQVTKVNGEENIIKDNVTSCHFTNTLRHAERKTIMEEFTGTWCGYCPKGMAGMKTLYSYYPDNFIGIALHYADPMDISCYGFLNSTGEYPICSIDRNVFVDPFFGSTSGTTNECEGILQDFVAANEKVAAVDIDMQANWVGDDFKKVEITATTEALLPGKYEPIFVLTADSLYKKSTSWMQENYLYKWTQEQWHGNEELGKYCADGEYGKEKFLPAYDDVMIGSSYYKSGDNTLNKLKATALATGEKCENSYTITLPTSDDLFSAIQASSDKVYAICIVLNENGSLANAQRVLVVDPNMVGIEAVTAQPAAQVVGEFALDGRRVRNARGIVLQHFSDGTCRKVLK